MRSRPLLEHLYLHNKLLNYEKNIDNIIQEIFLYAEENKCKIYFPKDVKVGKKLNDVCIEKDFKDQKVFSHA